MPTDEGVRIKPSDESFKNAKMFIEECLAVRSPKTLAERFEALSYFLRSWVSTYTHLCGSVERESDQLSIVAKKSTRELLTARKLLRRKSDLTDAQVDFLGLNAIFAKATATRK